MRLVTLVASAAAVVAMWASPSAAVTIDPGQYTGRYYVAGVTGALHGPSTVNLAAGTYAIDTGAFIAGSGFPFTVDAVGNVTVDSPAATAGGNTLAFNNVSIDVKTNGYAGRYILSPFFPTSFFGDGTVVLLPGVTYTLDNGTEIADSSLQFSLDGAGNVSTSAPAATGGFATLSLRTVVVQINPQLFGAKYYVSAFFPTPFVGPQSLAMLPGLTYTVDDGAEIGGSAFVFAVDASGVVSTTSGAATAAGSGLTFVNLILHIEPSTSDPYSVTGYPNLQGTTDIVVIPTVSIVVTTTAGSFVITPDLSFSATIDGLAISARAPYAASIQPPIRSDGSSVFKANRGVVPVKFTLAANGAATCQLPAATISVVRTSGAAPGLVNQSDYLQPSDNGSNFRIDSCQYIYNLGTTMLGAGQYLVQISINNIIVGKAVFGLN